jgi:hypothetical protein
LDMAGERNQGSVPRDMNFKSERRNALDYIKTEAQLLEFRADLEEASEEALDSSENQIRHVLYEHCVETEVSDYYIAMSQFPTLIRKTLEYYKALVDHVIILSNTMGGFQYAQMDLQHFAGKLAVRRKGSRTRLEVILKVYCDLRDAHRDKFIDPKLQQKKNALVFSKIASGVKAPARTPLVPGEPTDKACGRCSSKLHAGKGCPFNLKGIPYANARTMATSCKDATDFLAAAKKAAQDYLVANPVPPS